MMNFLKATVPAAVLALAMTGAAHAEIRIGASVSATGPAAFLGDPEFKTLEMLVAELNEKGGINGEQVKLIMYDDGGDANKARTFATRLIEDDEVVAIIGGTTTGTSMSILSVAEDAEIPFIALAGAIEIIQPVRPYTFKTPHTDRMACQKIYEDMVKRGFTKIGMISGTDGFGASMEAQCKNVAPDYKIDIVIDETYDPKDADMTAQLTKIRNAPGVQAVLNPGFGQGPSIVTRNYHQLGIELPMYQSHGVASSGFIKLAGEQAAEGLRLPGTALLIADQLDASDPQQPLVTAYKAKFEERYKMPVDTFGGYAHDALLIVTDAITRAGSAEPKEIRDAIEKTSGLAGATGIYTFSPEDHLGLDLTAFRMLQIKDGGWTVAE
ncbi:branched-chain amino acid transport system substrate-binding protein [Paenochrobactrum gallinarii]|uniref:Branched-chain amino acid transport system substrate-binding protein n=2 Tax=Paenochrobactrum gallinarii TaxID=643673 RepID=A0A841M5I3_9HYPH|nr:branched-chain amino acid transport system substrate-binding protein [Paenochrobactrum gallinarii]